MGSFIENVNRIVEEIDKLLIIYDDKETLDGVYALRDKLNSIFADKTKLNGLYDDKLILNTLYEMKDKLNSIFADKTKLNSLYDDKETLDSLYALRDKIGDLHSSKNAMDGLFEIIDKLNSIFADKTKLNSLYDDKETLDSIFNDKAKLDSIFNDKPTLDGLFAKLNELNSIFENLAEILQSGDNATTATQQAELASQSALTASQSEGNASNSATLASQKASEASASALTASQVSGYDTVSEIVSDYTKGIYATDGGDIEYKNKADSFLVGTTPNTFHIKPTDILVANELYHIIGDELFINPSITGGWTKNSDNSYTNDGTNDYQLSKFIGTSGVFSVDITTRGITSGNIGLLIGGLGGNNIIDYISTNGIKEYTFEAIGNGIFYLYPASSFDGTVTVSIRKLKDIVLPDAPFASGSDDEVISTLNVTTAKSKGSIVVVDKINQATNDINDYTAYNANTTIETDATENNSIKITSLDGIGGSNFTYTTIDVVEGVVIKLKAKVKIPSTNSVKKAYIGIGSSAGQSQDNYFAPLTTQTDEWVTVYGSYTPLTTGTMYIALVLGEIGVTAGGINDYVNFDIEYIHQKDEVYRVIKDMPIGSSVADTQYCEPISSIRRNDIVLHRINKVSKAHDMFSYRSINDFQAGESSSSIMNKEGFTLVNGMKDTYEDDTYYYSFICFVPRLNSLSYHYLFNIYGSRLFNDNQPWYYTTNTISSLADCYIYRSIATTSGRPDGNKENIIYIKGINGIADRRTFCGSYSYDEMIRMSVEICRDRRESQNVETVYASADDGVTPIAGVDGIYISPNITIPYDDGTYDWEFKLFYDGTYYKGNGIVVDTSINRFKFVTNEASLSGKTVTNISINKNDKVLVQGSLAYSDMKGSPLIYKQQWLDMLAEGKSLPFNALMIGQDGSDYIASQTNHILSKKKTGHYLGYNFILDVFGLNESYWRSFDYITNSFINGSLPDLHMMSYEADTDPLQKAINLPIISIENKVIGSNSYSIYKYGDYVRVATGIVPTGNGSNSIESKLLENVIIDEEDSTQLLTIPNHSTILLDSSNSSACKFYKYLANDNSQAVLQIQADILEWDGVDYGDNGLFDGINLNNSNDNSVTLNHYLPFRFKK